MNMLGIDLSGILGGLSAGVGGIGVYTWSAIVFIIIIALLLVKDRGNVRRESGIMFLRRTQRGKKFLHRLGRSRPRMWKWLGNVAVVVGFVMSVWFIWLMIAQLPLIASGMVAKESAGGILLPSLTDEATLGRGFILIPFWYWIVALAVILFSHEGMHAMLGINARIKIKSVGWGLLAVLPLGFVEPDEKQAEKKKPMEQLRFFAAGSFGNFIVAGVSLLILFLVFNPMYTANGVSYRAVAIGYPADSVNLTGYIIGIDGYAINSTDDLGRVLTMIGPNRNITVTTVNITETGSEQLKYVLTTAPDPAYNGSSSAGQRGYIGVAHLNNVQGFKPQFAPYSEPIAFFGGLFFWLFILNLGVGAFNLLPMKPLDGERLWRMAVQVCLQRRRRGLGAMLHVKESARMANRIMNGVSVVFLFILLAFFALVLI